MWERERERERDRVRGESECECECESERVCVVCAVFCVPTMLNIWALKAHFLFDWENTEWDLLLFCTSSNLKIDLDLLQNCFSSRNDEKDNKAKLPHPVYACVFRIALRFWSNNISFHRHKWNNTTTWKMQCRKRMCKRDVAREALWDQKCPISTWLQYPYSVYLLNKEKKVQYYWCGL